MKTKENIVILKFGEVARSVKIEATNFMHCSTNFFFSDSKHNTVLEEPVEVLRICCGHRKHLKSGENLDQ